MDLKTLYKKLHTEFGDLNWWPMDQSYHKKNKSDPRFEVIIGAILTQNTNWSNVKKAIDRLKKNRCLDINPILEIDFERLKKLIKSSGFFNQKAKRLKTVCKMIYEKYNYNLDSFFDKDIYQIRNELLELKGIGPETADSIILYAAGKPIFVVDAYTKRLCKRIPLPVKNSYDEIQKYFQDQISKCFEQKELTRIYKELHSLIVELAKKYCKKKPICTNCPLKEGCNFCK